MPAVSLMTAAGYHQSNGHIATPTHHSVTTPTHSPGPIRKTAMSASAPTTPLHTPAPSAMSPVSLTETTSLGKVLSPSKSPRPRRRSHEPVAAMLELGHANSFIKRLLPRNYKKLSKQVSHPDRISVSAQTDTLCDSDTAHFQQAAQTPTIEEELPLSPSPSPLPPSPPQSPLPPPAMLDFSEREGDADMRTRMSSVSGRPIRSTGICLTFGEDESSSDSELDSSSELGMAARCETYS